MDTLYTLKEKYPALVLPEVETFLATQDERTIDFVAFCLRELLISPHATSAFWMCFTAPSVYALTKVMRYYLNATVEITRDEELEDFYEARFQWPEGKLAQRLTAQVA